MTGTGQGFDENAWAANRPQERLVWVDCEMTGLDLSKDVLVEIAVLVTEADLTPLDDGIDVVIRATREQLAGMDPFVVNMHTESGLLPLIAVQPRTNRVQVRFPTTVPSAVYV